MRRSQMTRLYPKHKGYCIHKIALARTIRSNHTGEVIEGTDEVLPVIRLKIFHFQIFQSSHNQNLHALFNQGSPDTRQGIAGHTGELLIMIDLIRESAFEVPMSAYLHMV